MWRPAYDTYPDQRQLVSWYRDGKPSVWSEPSSLWPKFRQVTNILLERCPPPAVVLDVGCFTGYFLRHLSTLGYTGFGIDLQADLMRGLHETCRYGGPLDFAFCAAENIASVRPPASCDAILALDVMEHTLDERRCLDAFDHVLRHGGCVCFHVPRYDDDAVEHVRSYADPDDAKRLGARWGVSELLECTDEHGRATWLIVAQK